MSVIKLILGFLALIAIGVYVFIFLDIAVVSIRLIKSKHNRKVKHKDMKIKIKKVLNKIFNDYIAQIIVGNIIFLFVIVTVTTILLFLGFISFDLLRVLWLISVSPMYCLLILKIFFL